MATSSLPRPRANADLAKNIGLWAFQIAIAFMMITAAWPKLTSDAAMVQVFGAIGLGQWFRYLTGGMELAGAIGLLIPRLSGYAALLIAAVMFGAVLSHLFVLGGSTVPALALLAASLLVAWGRFWRK